MSNTFRNKLWDDLVSVTTWEEQCSYYIGRIQMIDKICNLTVILAPIVAIILCYKIKTLSSIVTMLTVSIIEVIRKVSVPIKNPEKTIEKVRKINESFGEMKDSLQMLWIKYENGKPDNEAINDLEQITKQMPKRKSEMDAAIPYMCELEDWRIRKRANKKLKLINYIQYETK